MFDRVKGVYHIVKASGYGDRTQALDVYRGAVVLSAGVQKWSGRAIALPIGNLEVLTDLKREGLRQLF